MIASTPELVDAVLGELELTYPIELADVLEVARRLTDKLGHVLRIEVYHRHRDLIVEVRDGFTLACRRVLTATP